MTKLEFLMSQWSKGHAERRRKASSTSEADEESTLVLSVPGLTHHVIIGIAEEAGFPV